MLFDYLEENKLPFDVPVDEAGNTVLAPAMSGRADELVERLIQVGSNLRATNAGGATILHTSAACALPERLVMILGTAAQSDIETRDITGSTPLIATSRGMKRAYEQVTEGCSAVMAPGFDYENAPEIMARVSILLDHGANVNATSDKGRTLLTNAMHYGYEPLVQLLLDRGAQPERGGEARLQDVLH